MLIVIFILSLLISKLIGKEFENRVKLLQTTKIILTETITMLEYYPVNIFEILAHFTKEEYSPMDTIFMNILKRCSQENSSPNEICKEEFSALCTKHSLSNKEVEVYTSMIGTLTTQDQQGAVAKLQITLASCDRFYKQALNDRDVKGAMQRKLAIFGGLILIIFLI